MHWNDFHVETEYLIGVNNPPSTVETAREIQFRDTAVPLYRPHPLSSNPLDDDALSTAMLTRRSPKAFADQRLSLFEVDNLIRLSYTGTSAAQRPTPSAGSIYAVKLHLLPVNMYDTSQLMTLEYGIRDESVSWNILGADPQRSIVNRVCLNQLKEHTGAIIFLSCSFDIICKKYGARGYRFGLIEIGHIAQNILLACRKFSLDAHILVGFADLEASRMFRLDSETSPVCYGLAIGHSLDSNTKMRRV